MIRALRARVDLELAEAFPDDPAVFADLYASDGESPTVALRVAREANGGWSLDGAFGVIESTDTTLTSDIARALNLTALDGSRDLLLFHAAAVTVGSEAIALVAPSGGGKTTLTAALLTRGAGYLSDEITAIDPVGHVVLPYPKPLSVKANSTVATDSADVDTSYPRCVRVSDIAEVATQPSPITTIVELDRREGAPARLTHVPRARMAMVLAEQSSYFADHGRDGLGRVADLVRATDCFRLTYDDALEAADLILAGREAAQVVGSEVVRRVPQVAGSELDGDVLLAVGDRLHLLDPLTGAVWNATASPIPAEEVVQEVAARTGNDPDSLREVVRDRIRTLVRLGACEVE